jgi:hypothetical protein
MSDPAGTTALVLTAVDELTGCPSCPYAGPVRTMERQPRG